MKKILAILTAFALAFVFVPNMDVKASGYSGSLSGPSSAYAGDTVTVSLNISAQNLTGANGAVSCDKGTINGMSTPLSGWYCGSGASFIIYENIGDFVGVSGSNTVLNISVTLPSGLAPGESVTVSVSNCEITYEGENLSYGAFSASHTMTINEPVVSTPPEEVPEEIPSESTPSESTPSENTPSESTPSESTPSTSAPSTSTPSQSNSSQSSSSGNTSSQSKEEKDTVTEEPEEETETTGEVTEEVKEEKENEKKEETSKKEETKEKPKREKIKLKIKINISKENWVGFFWGIGTVLVLEGIGVLAFFLWKRSSLRKENEKIHK